MSVVELGHGQLKELADLIADRLVEKPNANSTGARFAVRNPIGEKFVIDVEHVRGPAS
jgi:hypothetical protein